MTAVQPVVERTFCRFCIAQCGIIVTTAGDRVLAVKGDRNDPLSRGYTCPKGRALGAMHHDSRRLDYPMLRRDGELRRVSWQQCLDDLETKLRAILDDSEPDSVAMFLATASAFDASGRRLAERFLRGLGSRSRYTSATVDAPAKMLVSELMAGHPGLIPAIDRERATLVLLVGSNPVVSHGHTNAFPHPAVTLRRLAARGEVWVIDPRRTETANLATRHLAPRPGTDFVLLAHLVRELLREGADHGYLAEHAEGVERLQSAVEPFDLALSARWTGLDPAAIEDLLAALRRHGRVAGQTGTGVTMSAAANVTEWLMWALHIITRSYEQPGGMWFQPGLLHRLHERELEPSDGEPGPGPPSRPDLPSRWGERPSVALADEIEAGHVRALFVLGGNPLTSLPETPRLARALRKLDVLAVADVVSTDTTRLATHVLPCTGQLERADIPYTVDQFFPVLATRYTPALLPAAGERRPMWWLFAELGRRLGIPVLPRGLDPDTCSDDDLLVAMLERRPGLLEQLRRERVLVEEQAVFGWVEKRLLPGGRWRIAPEPLVSQLRELAEPPALVLVPRRQLRRLNSQPWAVGPAAGRVSDQPDILVNPEDAARAGLNDGELVEVRSDTGVLVGRLRLDPDLRCGAVSVPHGHTDPNVGNLTSARRRVDPLTGMVLQSGVPVLLRRATG